MKPNSLIELTNQLHSLPGISKKQAERIAFHLVQSESQVGEDLVDSIQSADEKIRECSICNHLTENDICDVCADEQRANIIVIVESPLDVFKFEENPEFKPRYHVLGGLVNVSKNIAFDKLKLEGLRERAKNAKEVILALSPNLEGIVTANYLKELLDGIKVTQLAQGIPLGAAMEYVDELTLKAALDNRKEF